MSIYGYYYDGKAAARASEAAHAFVVHYHYYLSQCLISDEKWTASLKIVRSLVQS